MSSSETFVHTLVTVVVVDTLAFVFLFVADSRGSAFGTRACNVDIESSSNQA